MTARGPLDPAPRIFQGGRIEACAARAGLGPGPPAGIEAMAKSNPFQFLQEVRNEAAKVTWPSRRETLITTGLVLAMVVVSSLFFLFTDTVIRWTLGLILGAR
jgi:preprotein translocase subunit SecE